MSIDHYDRTTTLLAKALDKMEKRNYKITSRDIAKKETAKSTHVPLIYNMCKERDQFKEMNKCSTATNASAPALMSLITLGLWQAYSYIRLQPH